jgi:hypothetical protein
MGIGRSRERVVGRVGVRASSSEFFFVSNSAVSILCPSSQEISAKPRSCRRLTIPFRAGMPEASPIGQASTDTHQSPTTALLEATVKHTHNM